jgi:hypothetical protein
MNPEIVAKCEEISRRLAIKWLVAQVPERPAPEVSSLFWIASWSVKQQKTWAHWWVNPGIATTIMLSRAVRHCPLGGIFITPPSHLCDVMRHVLFEERIFDEDHDLVPNEAYQRGVLVASHYLE